MLQWVHVYTCGGGVDGSDETWLSHVGDWAPSRKRGRLEAFEFPEIVGDSARGDRGAGLKEEDRPRMGELGM